jgi:SpoVK/Ycf46/Vps4 family AAA+-type ATPase
MVEQKGYKLERKRVCGTDIATVMARRIARGAGTKGFGNAREVRNQLEAAINRQSDRVGSIALHGHGASITEDQHRLLTRGDTIGNRPNLKDSPVVMELEGMIGLAKVKAAIKGLMELQLQNYDREMRGEKPELISLHRVFYGNPGTGKTTVAKIYGKLLKEFGFLSDGDFINTTASDLSGDTVGSGSTRTNEVIGRAKGKVLLIDEAYSLDPTRRGGGSYGGTVIDTLVEKIEGKIPYCVFIQIFDNI